MDSFHQIWMAYLRCADLKYRLCDVMNIHLGNLWESPRSNRLSSQTLAILGHSASNSTSVFGESCEIMIYNNNYILGFRTISVIELPKPLEFPVIRERKVSRYS